MGSDGGWDPWLQGPTLMSHHCLQELCCKPGWRRWGSGCRRPERPRTAQGTVGKRRSMALSLGVRSSGLP